MVHTLNSEHRRFKGLLYAGIMFTKSGPKVLEFNVRFGDPETQPIMMRLKSDLVPLLTATIDGTLEEAAENMEWDERAASCVVLTSGGYPGKYESGYEISGLDTLDQAIAFHAGTEKKEDGYVTSGGRVLGVTCLGKDLSDARTQAYKELEKVSFRGMHFRKDIGERSHPK
jgi:phosphoribosylamine--glycine ligase